MARKKGAAADRADGGEGAQTAAADSVGQGKHKKRARAQQPPQAALTQPEKKHQGQAQGQGEVLPQAALAQTMNQSQGQSSLSQGQALQQPPSLSQEEALLQAQSSPSQTGEAQTRHHPSPATAPAWTQPKTDWSARDAFDLTPDYARVRGNLLHLHATAARLYLPVFLADMRDYSIYDVPSTTFFTAVDSNTDALWDETFRPAGTRRGRTYTENGAVWTADDLNRIESAHARMRHDFSAQENGRTALKFTMGGGLLGACI